MTRFKLDENLPARAAGILRAAGHDVVSVLDQGLGGAPDAAVALACTQEDRVLITLDLDFADIRSYGSPDSPGIVVMRVARQDADTVCSLLQRVEGDLEPGPSRGSLWILEPSRLRVWREDD